MPSVAKSVRYGKQIDESYLNKPKCRGRIGSCWPPMANGLSGFKVAKFRKADGIESMRLLRNLKMRYAGLFSQADQIGQRVDLKFSHNAAAMNLYGLLCDV